MGLILALGVDSLDPLLAAYSPAVMNGWLVPFFVSTAQVLEFVPIKHDIYDRRRALYTIKL